MTLVSMTPEQAAAERDRLLGQLHFHRRGAKAAKRALDRLEVECARYGIRLVREPVRPDQGETHAGAHPHHR